MTLHISQKISDKVGNAIVISGSGRSGTTIIGKLVHSFEDVEYSFEPPMLITLMPLIEKMDSESWKLLYETYLYEEFLINALSGRAINTNLADDSSIYHVKDCDDINDRLNRSIRKLSSEEKAVAATLVYKLPNVVPFLPMLAQYYPKTRFLIMKRDAVTTINSLVQKAWFSDENVKTSMVWPYRLLKGIKIPSWVRLGDDALWVEISEIDRCAYYYIRINESLEHIPNRIELRYQDLLSEPEETAYKLANAFGLNFGGKTNQIIASIQPTEKNRDMEIMKKISLRFSEAVAHYSSQY